jgi:hypothetical protein
VSPIYGAHLQNPSFTNAWAASLRPLIRANEPYLFAGRRAPDKDFDATIRLDKNGDRVGGGGCSNIVFGS